MPIPLGEVTYSSVEAVAKWLSLQPKLHFETKVAEFAVVTVNHCNQVLDLSDVRCQQQPKPRCDHYSHQGRRKHKGSEQSTVVDP
jgi:hypothetical protein